MEFGLMRALRRAVKTLRGACEITLHRLVDGAGENAADVGH